jgi:Mg2+ and Co2+ transporter CorA
MPRLVTVHGGHHSALEALPGDISARLGHHRLGSSALLWVILEPMIDGSVELGIEARRAVDELEETMRAEVESDQIGATIMVFTPLTLVTSIYGMNFRYMPELASPYGYPLTLVVMLALAGGLLWFFYSRGWFD